MRIICDLDMMIRDGQEASAAVDVICCLSTENLRTTSTAATIDYRRIRRHRLVTSTCITCSQTAADDSAELCSLPVPRSPLRFVNSSTDTRLGRPSEVSPTVERSVVTLNSFMISFCSRHVARLKF